MSRVNPCAIEGSLVRLCLERVDIFHLHNAITETGGGGKRSASDRCSAMWCRRSSGAHRIWHDR
jgi:hypothetical protein